MSQLQTKQDTSTSVLDRILGGVERVGNKLPDPFMLFVYLALFIVGLSFMVKQFGVTVEHPGTGEELPIKSLLSAEGIEFILTSMLTNFTGFAPLGLVLAMMLGIGLADKVGLIEAGIKKTILNAPKAIVTYAIVFTGILGNLASDAAFVIVPPLAAMIFYTIGRHPLAGLAAGFAGVGAGFTANVIVAGTDALLSGIATEAIKPFDDTLVVTPVDNYYFMVTSVFILAIAGALITEKIIEPRLGIYKGKVDKELEAPNPLESKGLKNALIAGVVYIVLLALAVFWPESILRNEDGGLVPSLFLEAIVPITLFFFIIVGVTYGATVGKIKNTSDVPKFMAESMKDMAGYIVLIFAAAQFIAYFNWSNLGVWIAVNGADLLESMNLTGIPGVIGFVLLAAVLNLIIFSASAQWALMAPIFIPMFWMLDYHPAFIQAAFRIADSSTNIITPLNPYMVVVLAFMKDYDKKAGLGTLISLMLPYSLIFLGLWIIMLLVFALAGIPFGPGIDMKIM